MDPEETRTSEDPQSGIDTTDESGLEERLKGERGVSVGDIGLPATVVFKSDVESTSIYVDEVGNVSVSRGALPNPNLVIEGDHHALCSILQTREPTFKAPGAFKITVTKGTIRGFVVEIAEGQDIDHPLLEIYLC
ncbi:MAG: hypothetical protein OEM29_00420 [Thermoplasmata archaeon]|nr:hypothetical protein [Thermoplasmata archaeon]